MTHKKVKHLYSGKVKSLFTTEDPNLLITEFRDDTTAFDGVKHEMLQDKGRTNNKINAFFMEKLGQAGVPTHHVKLLSPSEELVKKLNMIRLECVVRNIAAGSLCKRYGITQGKKLEKPLFELFVKSDSLHDPLIGEKTAIALDYVDEKKLKEMEQLSLKINSVLAKLLAGADMTLVDAKFEFGVDIDGHLMLADEISPDSCRIWDVKSKNPLDKDRFRKDMGGVIEAYKEIAKRLGIEI